jgi:hypothetical protein
VTAELLSPEQAQTEQVRNAGWVRINGVWKNPALEREAQDSTFADDVDDVMERLARTFAANPIDLPATPERRICDRCGCLLLPEEACPGCLADLITWCEAEAIRWSWLPIPFTGCEEVTAA